MYISLLCFTKIARIHKKCIQHYCYDVSEFPLHVWYNGELALVALWVFWTIQWLCEFVCVSVSVSVCQSVCLCMCYGFVYMCVCVIVFLRSCVCIGKYHHAECVSMSASMSTHSHVHQMWVWTNMYIFNMYMGEVPRVLTICHLVGGWPA